MSDESTDEQAADTPNAEVSDAAASGAEPSATASPRPADTVPSDVVKSVAGFAAREGGAAQAVLQPIGAAGVRVTLVGEDGVLGDRVVDDITQAQQLVGALNQVEPAQWDRELTSKATVRPSHYRKMAGWVAHQKRFPKPRNSDIG